MKWLFVLRRWHAPLVAAVIAMAPLGAAAQPGSSDKAAAEALFQQGQKLFKGGEFDKACAKFDASQKLDAAVGTLLFLGDCYEKTNKTASAWATFVEASSLAERTGDQRKNIAEVRVAALGPQVTKLTVNVAAGNDMPDFAVRRGGVDVPKASWGTALPLDAGSYQLEASAPGKKTWSKTVEVKDGGEALSVDVPVLEAAGQGGGGNGVPKPDGPDGPGPTGPADGGGLAGSQIAGIVIGGVGLVGLAVGIAFGVMAKSKNDESLDPLNCRTEEFCTPEGIELRDDARTNATVSTATFIAGGVLLGGGILLFILAPGKDDGAQSGRGIEIMPSVGPTGGFMSAQGSF